MLKEIRKTPTGTEYWDTVEKRIVLIGIDLAKEGTTDQTAPVNISTHIKENGQTLQFVEANTFDGMTVKELKALAEEQGIDIPKSMTKRELVIERITGKQGEK